MMEVERAVNSRMGLLLKKWGVGGCPGQQLQAQGKTRWTREYPEISRFEWEMKRKIGIQAAQVRACK